MKDYPETHQQGNISLENIPKEFYGGIRSISGDLSVQIAKDGRIWININGIAFIRFKPDGK